MGILLCEILATKISVSRYYYAIVTCDSAKAAAHIYQELEGTELERSANVFDLSYVPEGMEFDDDFRSVDPSSVHPLPYLCGRDEATEEVSTSYKAVEFVTDV